MKKLKIFTVNPGSTSTKVALFEGGEKVFSANVSHDAATLNQFATLPDQLSYRRQMIEQLIAENHVDLSNLDAAVGRGGGLIAMEGGTYEADELLLHDSINCANGVPHPAGMGASLARLFADAYGGRTFVVNPPDVDELQDVARVTGIKGVYRTVHLHSLNLKETAIRHARGQGNAYEKMNLIVCHIGGGVSVSAHRGGRMVDGYDIVGGEGPMAPTRCGEISVTALLDYAQGQDVKTVRDLCSKTGGFVSHLGISDAIEVNRRIEAGDKHAEIVWNAMIYQICKGIGAMSAVLQGRVDGILLGGGMVHSQDLVDKIKASCGSIAEVYAYPGEFEMEAMEAGASRVLRGEEQPKRYTGKPVFQGFDFIPVYHQNT